MKTQRRARRARFTFTNRAGSGPRSGCALQLQTVNGKRQRQEHRKGYPRPRRASSPRQVGRMVGLAFQWTTSTEKPPPLEDRPANCSAGNSPNSKPRPRTLRPRRTCHGTGMVHPRTRRPCATNTSGDDRELKSREHHPREPSGARLLAFLKGPNR